MSSQTSTELPEFFKLDGAKREEIMIKTWAKVVSFELKI